MRSNVDLRRGELRDDIQTARARRFTAEVDDNGSEREFVATDTGNGWQDRGDRSSNGQRTRGVRVCQVDAARARKFDRRDPGSFDRRSVSVERYSGGRRLRDERSDEFTEIRLVGSGCLPG